MGMATITTTTVTTLAELKAAATSKVSIVYDAALWTWTAGDYSGKADDVNVAKGDGQPLTAGAWVRQSVASVTFAQPASGATTRRASIKIAEGVSIADFGASPALADNSAAIQRAIDSGAGQVYIPVGTFSVRPQAHSGLPGTFGDNSVCIKPRSGLTLYGPGILKLGNGAGGPSGAVIGNWDGMEIEDVSIEVCIDGNAASASGQMSGVVLVNAANCCVKSKWVRSLSFNGVQFARASNRCTVESVAVSAIGYIGIQFQKARAAKVIGNKLVDVSDNAIDLECDGSNQYQNVIIGNSGKGCSTFVFLESGGNTIISSNDCEDIAEAGIWLNRINTSSENNIITNNRFTKGSRAGAKGAVYCNNACGKSLIEGNFIVGFDAGMTFEGAAGYLFVDGNYFSNIGRTLYRVTKSPNALVKSLIRNTVYEGPLGGSAGNERFPFTASPMSNPSNVPNRQFHTRVESFWNLDAGGPRAASPDEEYRTGLIDTLRQNPAWGNAYSVYDGTETLIFEEGPALTVGRYVLINGTTYKVHSNPSSGVFAIRNGSGAAGNFTSNTNGAHPFIEYWPEWQLD